MTETRKLSATEIGPQLTAVKVFIDPLWPSQRVDAPHGVVGFDADGLALLALLERAAYYCCGECYGCGWDKAGRVNNKPRPGNCEHCGGWGYAQFAKNEAAS